MAGPRLVETQSGVLLIGGSSHAGKSTVAAHLGRLLGWPVAATDTLARHPGRPWRQGVRDVPAHVADHYLASDDEARLTSVLDHYQRLWPVIEGVVRAAIDAPAPEGLVFEGSAIWPPAVARMDRPEVSAIWLTAEDDVFEARIHAESGYQAADPPGRRMIDAFVERTRRFNRAMMIEVARLGLTSLDVGSHNPDQVAALCLARACRP